MVISGSFKLMRKYIQNKGFKISMAKEDNKY